jgi:hypothetical protein
MEILKTILAMVGGILMGLYAADVHVFGLVDDKQVFIGLILFLMSMFIHVLNGGSVLPWRKNPIWTQITDYIRQQLSKQA